MSKFKADLRTIADIKCSTYGELAAHPWGQPQHVIHPWLETGESVLLVRRQMLGDGRCAELAEDLAHLGCEVMRLGCGAASGVVGWSAA